MLGWKEIKTKLLKSQLNEPLIEKETLIEV
jgi:hypothetical protein